MARHTADTGSLVRIIKQARLNAGMTQEGLAQALGFRGESVISMIESGRRNIDIEKIPMVAVKLGLNARELTQQALLEYFPTVYLVLFDDDPPSAGGEVHEEDLYRNVKDLPRPVQDAFRTLIDFCRAP